MKPLNVVDHHHYFVYSEDEENGEGPRFDAYLTEEGEAGVWSPQSNQSWPADNYKTAKFIAEKMAKTHRELNPR